MARGQVFFQTYVAYYCGFSVSLLEVAIRHFTYKLCEYFSYHWTATPPPQPPQKSFRGFAWGTETIDLSPGLVMHQLLYFSYIFNYYELQFPYLWNDYLMALVLRAVLCA